MITEDYVSFETAKLLKEKGFDEECSCFYNNIEYGTPGLEVDGQLYYKNSANLDDEEYAAPTLQMAMKWLREEYNLHINPYKTKFGWYFEIFDLTDCDITGCKTVYSMGIPPKEWFVDSYEDAVAAAFKYCEEHNLF